MLSPEAVPGTWVSGYPLIWVSGYLGIWVSWYPGTRIPRYPDTQVPGYPGTRIPRYPDTQIPDRFYFLVPITLKRLFKILTEHLSHTNRSLKVFVNKMCVGNIEARNYYSMSTFIMTVIKQ